LQLKIAPTITIKLHVKIAAKNCPLKLQSKIVVTQKLRNKTAAKNYTNFKIALKIAT